MPETSAIPRSVKISYAFGHIFNDFCASMWFTYLLVYFKAVLNFDNVLSGAGLAIGQVADGISTQLVGILSDRSSNHWLFRYGRRKTWHLIGTICVFISFPFIFSPVMVSYDLTDFQKLLYYCFFIVLFQFGWAAVQISHLSLVPDLTPNEDERMGLYNLRYSFTVIANVFVYVLLWILFKSAVKERPLGPHDKLKFQIVAWTVTIIGSLTSVIFHIFVKEGITRPSDEISNTLLENTRPMCRSLFFSYKLYFVAIIYICTRLFTNLSQVYIPNYLHNYLKATSVSLAVLPLIMYISSFITSVVIKPLAATFGKHITYAIGAVVGIVASIWVLFGRYDDSYYRYDEIYGVVIAFGIAGAILLVTSLSITADLIGGNTHCGSMIYGFMSLCDKVANGLVVLIAENLGKLYSCTLYDRNVLVIICSSSAFVAILFTFLLRFKYSSTRTTEEQFRTNLNSHEVVTDD